MGPRDDEQEWEQCSPPKTCDSCKEDADEGWPGSVGSDGLWFCRRCWEGWFSSKPPSQLKAPSASQRAPTSASKKHGGPAPIFVVGLPKCGTTSLQHALETAGYGAVHCHAPRAAGLERFVGQRLLRAVEEGKAPLAFLPDWVDAITQMDCWWMDWKNKDGEAFEPAATALFPQILILEELDRAYPSARFILSTRDARSWLRSVDTYGHLREILVRAELPGLPSGQGAQDEELIAWFNGHTDRVRTYFAGREASKLLEFSLEEGDDAVAGKLEAFLGIPTEWGHHNVTTWA